MPQPARLHLPLAAAPQAPRRRWIWLEFSNHNLLDDPAAGYVDCEMFDISEEMEAHELVRASEQLLRSLAGALPVGVVQFDLDRRIVYANERLYEIVGADPDTDEDTLLTCVVDSDVIEDALARLYSGDDVDIELYMDRLDGSGRRRARSPCGRSSTATAQ